MEELVRLGLCREIGMCNLGTAGLRDMLSYADIPPAVLQAGLPLPPPAGVTAAASAACVHRPTRRPVSGPNIAMCAVSGPGWQLSTRCASPISRRSKPSRIG